MINKQHIQHETIGTRGYTYISQFDPKYTTHIEGRKNTTQGETVQKGGKKREEKGACQARKRNLRHECQSAPRSAAPEEGHERPKRRAAADLC